MVMKKIDASKYSSKEHPADGGLTSPEAYPHSASEAAYDEKIMPLVDQLYAACRREGVGLVLLTEYAQTEHSCRGQCTIATPPETASDSLRTLGKLLQSRSDEHIRSIVAGIGLLFATKG